MQNSFSIRSLLMLLNFLNSSELLRYFEFVLGADDRVSMDKFSERLQLQADSVDLLWNSKQTCVTLENLHASGYLVRLSAAPRRAFQAG